MSEAAPPSYRVKARNIDPTVDNKIHDDEVARRLGFSAALVPGVELFAYLCHPLVAAWGEDFLRSGRVDVRFRRPVYDGEEVAAAAEPDGDAWTVTLTGPDGDVRCAGGAWFPDGEPPPDLGRFAPTPTPDVLPDAGPDSLRPGALGSVSEPVTAQTHDRYLDDIDESLPLHRDRGVVQPGVLLRVVNALLVRNVRLGPWIHTGSNCRFLGVARLPTTLTAHGIVTDNYERNRHLWVRYDAVVLADDRPVMYVAHTAIYQLGF